LCVITIARETVDRIGCFKRFLAHVKRKIAVYLLEVGPGELDDPSICKSIILKRISAGDLPMGFAWTSRARMASHKKF
jgi:hypothetical protein